MYGGYFYHSDDLRLVYVEFFQLPDDQEDDLVRDGSTWRAHKQNYGAFFEKNTDDGLFDRGVTRSRWHHRKH